VKKYAHERDVRLNQDQNYVASWGGALGGGTTLNGQIAIRANRESLDEWVTLFNLTNWGYFGLLPYLVNLENNSRYDPNDNTHLFSNQGPVPINPELTTGTYNNLYLESLAQSPIHQVTPNPYCSSAADIRGSCFVDKTMDTRRSRRYASENYLDPILHELDITVLSDAQVTTLITSRNGDKVEGVNVLINGETQSFKTRGNGEVIVAAGPFETPKILMLSGYGPAAQLSSFGIPVKRDLPVGQNLHDHPGFVYINLGNITEPKNVAPIYPPSQADIDEWQTSASGRLAQGSDPITAFYSTGLNGNEVDMQISFGDGVPLFSLPDPNAYFIECYNVKPKSRGSITLRSPNPAADPVVNLNYLSDPEGTDLAVLTECIKFAHQLSTDTVNSPLASWTIGNILPGLSEEYWALPDSILDTIIGEVVYAALQQGYHFGGTVPMGLLLDETLQIPTVSGLRVSGVTVHPKVVGHNPQLVTYATSEKLADLIKKDLNKNVHYKNSLHVQSLCNGKWQISNSNNQEAVFDWVARDATTNANLYQGTYHVAAGSTAVIYTDAEPIRVRLSVYLNGNLQGVSDNTAC
jgi:choline dehydrogenase-like flavoprotein